MSEVYSPTDPGMHQGEFTRGSMYGAAVKWPEVSVSHLADLVEDITSTYSAKNKAGKNQIRDRVLGILVSNSDRGYFLLTQLTNKMLEPGISQPASQNISSAFSDIKAHFERFVENNRPKPGDKPREGVSRDQTESERFIGKLSYLEVLEKQPDQNSLPESLNEIICLVLDAELVSMLLPLLSADPVSDESVLRSLAFIHKIMLAGAYTNSSNVRRYLGLMGARPYSQQLTPELFEKYEKKGDSVLDTGQLLVVLLRRCFGNIYRFYASLDPEIATKVDDIFRLAAIYWRSELDGIVDIKHTMEFYQKLGGPRVRDDDTATRREMVDKYWAYHKPHDGQGGATPFTGFPGTRVIEIAAGDLGYPYDLLWRKSETDAIISDLAGDLRKKGDYPVPEMTRIVLPDGRIRIFDFYTTINSAERMLMIKVLSEQEFGEITHPDAVQSILRFTRPAPYTDQIRAGIDGEVEKATSAMNIPSRLLHAQGDAALISPDVQELVPFEQIIFQYAGRIGHYRVQLVKGKNSVIFYMNTQDKFDNAKYNLFLDPELKYPFGMDSLAVAWWRGVAIMYLHGLLYEKVDERVSPGKSGTRKSGYHRAPQGPHLRRLQHGQNPDQTQITLAREYYARMQISFDLLEYSRAEVEAGRLPVTFVNPGQEPVWMPPSKHFSGQLEADDETDNFSAQVLTDQERKAILQMPVQHRVSGINNKLAAIVKRMGSEAAM